MDGLFFRGLSIVDKIWSQNFWPYEETNYIMCVISKVFSSLVEDSNNASHALDVYGDSYLFSIWSFFQQAIIKGPYMKVLY